MFLNYANKCEEKLSNTLKFIYNPDFGKEKPLKRRGCAINLNYGTPYCKFCSYVAANGISFKIIK